MLLLILGIKFHIFVLKHKNKTMKKIILVGFIAGILSSCSSSKKVTESTNAKDPILNQNVNGLITRPLLADLSVDKVRKEVTYTANLKISEIDRNANAMQLFLDTHQCDFVVDPIFTNTKTDINGRTKEIKIKLTGLPAKYENIKQVDEIPKSIEQYRVLANPVMRNDYINSIEESNPTIGVEVNLGRGGQQGIQVDFLLKNEIMRGYISAESFNAVTPSFTLDMIADGDTTLYNASGSASSFNSISAGLMKEFPVLNRVNFRAVGGLNYSNYGNLGIISTPGEIENISRIGLRIGLGLDIRIYKSISFVLKAHSNINALNLYSKNSAGTTSFKVKNLDMNDSPFYYLGYGVRIVF